MRSSRIQKIIFFTLILHFAFLILHSFSYALDVKRVVLPNGLTMMVVERHNLPVVKVSIGINAGNLHEPADKAGLANLTAGLLSEGTKSRTAQQFSEEIEFVGGSVGVSGGGDYVSASLSVLKKDVELGFELLSDMVLNPVFPEDEINKKIERIKASLKAREEDPGFVAAKNFKAAVFGEHPYGRLVSGTPETLDRITREDLKDFHRMYYLPNNSIMAVVGDITSQEAEQLIEKYFKSWKQRDEEILSLPVLSAVKEKKTVIINKDLTQATIKLGHIGISRNHPDYYAVSVMNYILGGGGFGSRLMRNIREEKGLAYDVHSFFSANKYGGSFQVGLQTKNESANTAIDEVLKEMKIMMKEQVSDTDLSDAKLFLTGSFPMRIETSSRIAGFLVAVEYFGLGSKYIDNYPGYINSVSKEDVLKAARKYLDPEHFVLVVVADQEKAALKKEYK